MKVISMNEKGFKQPVVLALGFFDSLHIGHKQIVQAAINQAKKLGVLSALFTFSNNPSKVVGKSYKLINLFEERVKILEECGIDIVIYTEFTKQFMETSHIDFLENLLSNFNIAGVVCGTDYRFGAKGLGDVNYLQQTIQNVTVLDLVQFNNHKASSTDVRLAIEQGDIVLANKALISPYSVSGIVLGGHTVGRELGFRTANLDLPYDKQIIKDGVYITKTEIDSDSFISVTSVGTRKTFDDLTNKIETHLLDYNGGDFYGKQIKVIFYQRLRDMCKFESKQLLAKQVEIDKKKARLYFC